MHKEKIPIGARTHRLMIQTTTPYSLYQHIQMDFNGHEKHQVSIYRQSRGGTCRVPD